MGGRGKPVWKKTGVAQLICRPHPLIHKTGPGFKGQRRARGKKNMRVYKRHGGLFLRASFSFNNTKVSPEGVAKSAYMLHATPPDYSRIFCRLLRRYLLLVFSVFLTKGRERALSDRKKFCETPAVQRSCYLFFLVNFWRTCWLDFCHNYFCHKLYDFFSRRGCWWCEFFVFLLHNDYLKPVFFYLAQRGERRFVVDIGSLSSSPTAWLKNR